MPAPSADQRILLFSPHPDDETLGCGGLIQQAIAAHTPLTVAFLTNGDGFRVAVERQYRELRIGPEDYLRFAALRQQETYRALDNLGVSRDQIRFLGYPDRGLLSLWTDNWAPDHLYRSPYTQRDHAPYPLTLTHNAPYCGQSALEDIVRVMREQMPTDIYVTHPSDDHPDHTAASSFVTLALDRMREAGEPWAKSAQLHYYIVHRGDWPVPQGLYKSDPLSPPSEMANLDTAWVSRSLTAAEVEAKSRSILAYGSQTAVMKRFLVSFARQNEVFGSLKDVRVAGISPRKVDGGMLRDWSGIDPVVRDPVNDSLLRDFQGGGDVRSVYAARDASRLYLRVETYQPLSSRVELRIRMRYFGDTEQNSAGGSFLLSVRPGVSVVPAQASTSFRDNTLDVSIPLRDLAYAHRLALDVDTLFAGLQVDRTGYRFLTL
jgi:LmbE family N-acetylglucosaminyl deacetylase